MASVRTRYAHPQCSVTSPPSTSFTNDVADDGFTGRCGCAQRVRDNQSLWQSKDAKERRGGGGRVRDKNGGGAFFFYFIFSSAAYSFFFNVIRNKIVKFDPFSTFIRNNIFFPFPRTLDYKLLCKYKF
jgi:hypothetical protein